MEALINSCSNEVDIELQVRPMLAPNLHDDRWRLFCPDPSPGGWPEPRYVADGDAINLGDEVMGAVNLYDNIWGCDHSELNILPSPWIQVPYDVFDLRTVGDHRPCVHEKFYL